MLADIEESAHEFCPSILKVETDSEMKGLNNAPETI